MDSYWITPEGIDYLTKIIDHPGRYSNYDRELDILGVLEGRGGGYSEKQTIDWLSVRPIEDPLIGTRDDYKKTFRKLESRGYIVNVGR